MKSAQQWFEEGNALFEAAKFSDANKCYDEVLALDPKFMEAYRGKFKALRGLGKNKQVIMWCDKAIEIDPTYKFAYNSKGLALWRLGKIESAIEWFDKGIEIDPNWSFLYSSKGSVLLNLKRYDEAVQCFDKCLSLDPVDYSAHNGKALALSNLGRDQEAKEIYDNIIKLKPNKALYLCNRGKVLSRLGMNAEALADLKKVQEILEGGYVDVDLTPGTMHFIQKNLRAVVELEHLEAQTEDELRKADQNNPAIKEFIKNITVLRERRKKVTATVIANMDDKNLLIYGTMMTEVEGLRGEFQVIKEELARVKTDVKKELGDIKEELENKMDDYNKKLDHEINKLDLTPEDAAKLRQYFKAFVETFSSAHIAAQVVESGQVQLDNDNTKATILSTIASFTPFIGSILSSGIQSIGDFLSCKEMKSSARKMKGLASDAIELHQIVGKSGYEIVLDQEKKKQILEISPEDLKKSSNTLFQKMTTFIENLSEEIDVYLYTKLYRTPAARLGHNDANSLIEEWISGKIDHFNAQEDFVKKALEVKEKSEPLQQVTSPSTPDKEETGVETLKMKKGPKNACCNLF